MDTVNDILSQVEEFPTLPTIYSRLLDLLSDSRTTVEDLAKLISTDQAASTKILKTVNSSMFGLQVKVDTISQAIFQIGFNEIKNLVMALSVVDMFSSSKSNLKFNLLDLWKHSIAVGVITRIIGQKIGIKNLENFYLAGMLHDLGKLFFLKDFNDEYSRVINHVEENDVSIIEAENKVLGINHADTGALLAERWNLPDSLKLAIKYHHDCMDNGQSEIELACVYIADIMSRILGLGSAGDDVIPQPNEKVWEKLQLPDNFFVDNLDNIVETYNQSVSILLLNN